jgi:glycosyltransferase involved in cell wall biosynthesis
VNKSHPLRVIHIVHGKANPASHNGISRVVYHLNKQEKLLGCNSEIWAVVDGTSKHRTHVRDPFVTVECYPRVRLPVGSHAIIDALLAEKDTIDLVHFHLIWFYDKNIIAKALKLAGIPFIITTHGTYSTPHAYTGKRRLARLVYERAFLNMAAEIHAITREEGTGLLKYGYHGPSFVAYNGIDPEEIPAERRCDYFASKPYSARVKLIWVGVLREDKNLRGLIRAVAMLPPELRNQVACVLVGPDYKGNAAQYAALAEELGCSENFDYIGPLYGQDKYDAIESADACVMPSFSEVMSLAVLDAMACGKPCLITTGCGYVYFQQEDFSVLCEPYPQDLAVGLQKLLARQEEWSAMGARARALVEREFNWSAIARGILPNYARIVEEAQHVV